MNPEFPYLKTTVPREKRCPDCAGCGCGENLMDGNDKCSTCGGTGFVIVAINIFDGEEVDLPDVHDHKEVSDFEDRGEDYDEVGRWKEKKLRDRKEEMI